MIKKEVLKQHYREYGNLPNTWVLNMAKTKMSIVKKVLENLKDFKFNKKVKVAILGASDKRYIKLHETIFQKLLKKEIGLKTIDIDLKHLGKGKNLILHNVTKKFPEKFDIIFSHELMKFLTEKEQFLTILNSYKALNKNGFAMHIIHEPAILGTKELRDWQFKVNPDMLVDKIKKEGISIEKMFFKSNSKVSWLKNTTVLVLKK